MSRLARAIAASLLVLAVTTPGAGATHSVPSPRWFWDPNLNGTPGPSPAFDPEAIASWSASELDRLDEVVAEWSSKTNYNPTVGNTTHDVYVDGRVPACEGDWFVGGDFAYAATCIYYTEVTVPSGILYVRINTADIYMNMDNEFDLDWWTGSTHTSEDRLHFAGVLTHEMGHTVLLEDEYDATTCTETSTGWMTMCGNLGIDERNNSWRATTLHADDIAGADLVY